MALISSPNSRGVLSQNLITSVPAPVPEPATASLLLFGIAGFAVVRPRKGKAQMPTP